MKRSFVVFPQCDHVRRTVKTNTVGAALWDAGGSVLMEYVIVISKNVLGFSRIGFGDAADVKNVQQFY